MYYQIRVRNWSGKMKPIGPLMVEHRLIERMVSLLDRQMEEATETSQVSTNLISTGVDFFRTYADKTHHGKEEDILFRELSQKWLSGEHKEMMELLIQEHIFARKSVGRLSDANHNYIEGDEQALEQIVYELGQLVKFYPEHIEKEDRHFFIPIMDYFSQDEQQKMLEKFWEFDRTMIHEKYKRTVEEIEKTIQL
jgi:hemerythrin-like domain-containing protein